MYHVTSQKICHVFGLDSRDFAALKRHLAPDLKPLPLKRKTLGRPRRIWPVGDIIDMLDKLPSPPTRDQIKQLFEGAEVLA